MGCGVSRPITDERTAPVSGGFRPIRRRIEEIKRMRGGNTITGSTPSKKELLEGRAEVEDDDESHTSPKSSIHDHHTQKNNTEDGVKATTELLSSMPEKEGNRISISDNNMKPLPAPAPKEKDGSRISISDNTMKPLPAPAPAPKEKEGSRLSISDNTMKPLPAPAPAPKEKEGSRLSISDNIVKPLPAPATAPTTVPATAPAPAPILTSGEKRTEVVVEKGGGGGGGGEKEKKEGHEEEEEDGENDEEENEYGYIDGPSSPSFRDYYVPSVGNSMELTDTSKEEDANEGGKKEKKTRRNESIASSEESVTQLVKKRSSKGRRFRRVLPKGLNVRSCYTPPCTSSHDNPQQLLNSKVVHAS